MSTVSTITSSEFEFPIREVPQYEGAGRPARPSFELDIENLGFGLGITVEPQGQHADGPWGVDVDLNTNRDGAASPAEARRWAHALLAAADLAEHFEQEQAEQPC